MTAAAEEPLGANARRRDETLVLAGVAKTRRAGTTAARALTETRRTGAEAVTGTTPPARQRLMADIAVAAKRQQRSEARDPVVSMVRAAR